MSGQVRGQVDFDPARLNAEIDRLMLTGDEAARLLCVPEKTLRRWRNGEVTPRRAAIRRMAEIFEREPLWFCPSMEQAA